MFAPTLERNYRKHMIPQYDEIHELSLPLNIKGTPLTFPRFIERYCFDFEKLIRKQIKDFLEKMDKDFRYSEGRTINYYVNNTRERTITTMYGDICYIRTIYKDRSSGKMYCYVDERLGIDRYIRYTNDVAAYAAEAYSDENSMIKVGIELGNLIYAKFSLCDNRTHSVPRQTIYNLLSRVKQIRIQPDKDKRVIDTLYILMDEKYLPDHSKPDSEGNKTRSSKMAKAALICEGLDRSDKNRHKYINPSYFSLFKGDYGSELISYIDQRYDLKKMKNICVLADGASWIKRVSNDLKFHVLLSICRRYLSRRRVS